MKSKDREAVAEAKAGYKDLSIELKAELKEANAKLKLADKDYKNAQKLLVKGKEGAKRNKAKLKAAEQGEEVAREKLDAAIAKQEGEED